jgi:hypothetical protein
MARNRIRYLFEEQYASFLVVSKTINERIFVARKLNMKITPAIPDKISRIVYITTQNSRSGRSSGPDNNSGKRARLGEFKGVTRRV